MTTITKYIESLKKSPKGPIFNPWWHTDKENDDYSNSAEIRRRQLIQYLEERKNSAKYLLVGEALGYQGGHFTGIAMTSERILLGKMKHKGIEPEYVMTALQPSRTSKENVRQDGFTEPTATIVWGHLLEMGIDPYSFVLWNALPWHPYKSDKGMLSNRTPKDTEMLAGLEKLKQLIDLLKPQIVIAVGQKAADQLARLDIEFSQVRHPANGGATKFRDQFAQIAQNFENSGK
jgi:uracil-DNA glycosylase